VAASSAERFVSGVLQAEGVEHEVERLTLLRGDDPGVRPVHVAPPLGDGVPSDRIGSNQGERSEPGKAFAG